MTERAAQRRTRRNAPGNQVTLRFTSTRRRALKLLVFASLAPPLTGVMSPAAADSDVDAVMARVIDANRAAVHGVVGFQSDSRLRVGAGFYHRLEQERRWFVLGDGMLVKTGLRPGSDAPFGKPAEQQSHEPWGPYGDEYRFADAPCPRCAAGLVAIAFQSAIHDTQHGSGVLIVDAAHDRVLHETQEPYVLHGDARTGVIDIDFGDTGVGWLPRELRGTFTGNVGPFSGSAHLTQAFAEYRHYPSPEAAASALGS